eukprot:jgi/Mesvir1/346/Mv22750-RA.1
MATPRTPLALSGPEPFRFISLDPNPKMVAQEESPSTPSPLRQMFNVQPTSQLRSRRIGSMPRYRVDSSGSEGPLPAFTEDEDAAIAEFLSNAAAITLGLSPGNATVSQGAAAVTKEEKDEYAALGEKFWENSQQIEEAIRSLRSSAADVAAALQAPVGRSLDVSALAATAMASVPVDARPVVTEPATADGAPAASASPPLNQTAASLHESTLSPVAEVSSSVEASLDLSSSSPTSLASPSPTVSSPPAAAATEPISTATIPAAAPLSSPLPAGPATLPPQAPRGVASHPLRDTSIAAIAAKVAQLQQAVGQGVLSRRAANALVARMRDDRLAGAAVMRAAVQEVRLMQARLVSLDRTLAAKEAEARSLRDEVSLKNGTLEVMQGALADIRKELVEASFTDGVNLDISHAGDEDQPQVQEAQGLEHGQEQEEGADVASPGVSFLRRAMAAMAEHVRNKEASLAAVLARMEDEVALKQEAAARLVALRAQAEAGARSRTPMRPHGRGDGTEDKSPAPGDLDGLLRCVRACEGEWAVLTGVKASLDAGASTNRLPWEALAVAIAAGVAGRESHVMGSSQRKEAELQRELLEMSARCREMEANAVAVAAMLIDMEVAAAEASQRGGRGGIGAFGSQRSQEASSESAGEAEVEEGSHSSACFSSASRRAQEQREEEAQAATGSQTGSVDGGTVKAGSIVSEDVEQAAEGPHSPAAPSPTGRADVSARELDEYRRARVLLQLQLQEAVRQLEETFEDNQRLAAALVSREEQLADVTAAYRRDMQAVRQQQLQAQRLQEGEGEDRGGSRSSQGSPVASEVSDGSCCLLHSVSGGKHPAAAVMAAEGEDRASVATSSMETPRGQGYRGAPTATGGAAYTLPAGVSVLTSQLKAQDLLCCITAMRGTLEQAQATMRSRMEEGYSVEASGNVKHAMDVAALAADTMNGLGEMLQRMHLHNMEMELINGQGLFPAPSSQGQAPGMVPGASDIASASGSWPTKDGYGGMRSVADASCSGLVPNAQESLLDAALLCEAKLASMLSRASLIIRARKAGFHRNRVQSP